MYPMRRIAIFASYNKNSCVDDYVVYYLRELQKVADKILFFADNELRDEEAGKITDLVYYHCCQHHGCYDFGSYKRGYEYAKHNGLLDDADELIFCNDSCYGPVFPFEQVFCTMEKKSCDYWGLTESHEYKDHIQSFFLVFKKNVFESETFHDYVNAFEGEDNVLDIIFNYELTIVERLSQGGFKYATLITTEELSKESRQLVVNPVFLPVSAINLGMPLIKRKDFLLGYEESLQESLMELVSLVEDKNKELHDIILNDLKNLYSGFSDIPQNILTETAFLLEKNVGGQVAVKALYKMFEELIYKRPQFIGNLFCDNNAHTNVYNILRHDNARLLRKYKKYKRLTRYSVLLLAITLISLIISLII